MHNDILNSKKKYKKQIQSVAYLTKKAPNIKEPLKVIIFSATII